MTHSDESVHPATASLVDSDTSADSGSQGTRQLTVPGVLPVLAWVAVAMTAGFGLVLRVSLRGGESLWLDELWTLDAVSRTFKEMVGSRLVSDQAPPVWTSLTWLWLRTVRTYDPVAMRSLSTFFSVVAVAAPLAGALRIRALRAPFIVMAGLFSLSLLAVQFAVELRNYSFTMALGSIATVLWAGLLTGQLPRTNRWIFAFALAGAIGGFAHYYGNLLYAGLLTVLVVAWLTRLPRRPLFVLLAWGSLSLVPVVTWYFATRRWSPGIAVAAPPNVAELKNWMQYSFAPLTNVLSGQPPAYPDGSPGTGAGIAGAVVLVLLVALGIDAVSHRRTPTVPPSPSTLLGGAAVVVVVLGVTASWVISLLLPPSMNVRNLSAFVPALFLATACATTVARRDTIRWVSVVLVLGVWLAVTGTFVSKHGVMALGPPWQKSAGYEQTAAVLVDSQRSPTPPDLVGLQQPWAWHGDWDAVVRAHTGVGPAISTDPEPLPVAWVMGAEDPLLATVSSGPLIVFAYAGDARGVGLFAWAEQNSGPCTMTTYGSPGFGNIEVATCRGSR